MLKKDWIGPNFSFPAGMSAPIEYFSRFSGLDEHTFILRHKKGDFSDWFV